MIDPRTEDEIAEYVRSRLDDSPHGTQAKLARELGVDTSAITGIKKGTRGVSAEELNIIKEFFGDGANPAGELRSETVSGGVRIVGRIGENIWAMPSGNTASARHELVPAVDLTYPIEEQSAWNLEETTLDGEYRQGDRLYTVPFSDNRSKPLLDDVLVVKTERDGFERFTLKRAVAREKGVVLESMFGERAKPKRPGETETIHGLVIAFLRQVRKR